MIALHTLALLYAMWLAYVLAMHVIYRWDTLTLTSKVLGAPPALLAYVADVLLNTTGEPLTTAAKT